MISWLVAHPPLSLVVALFKAWVGRHRPELRLHEIGCTGGNQFVDFHVDIQNVGTKPERYTVSATVDGKPVRAHPSPVDLLGNAPPTRIHVPINRPGVGDLVPAFHNEPTLYGRELVVEVFDMKGRRKGRQRWREHVYTAEENSVRQEIQQNIWAEHPPA